MADILPRSAPVGEGPLTFAGGTMSLLPAVPRFCLRGAAADLAPLLGVPLPRRIGEVSAVGEALVAMIGPDEWLAIGAVPAGSAGLSVAVVDISERQIGVRLDGPGAAAVLMAGCPLDLETMAPGRGTRTLYETVEIVVVKLGAQAFHIEVWRSFAPWLWAALAQAAADIGSSG